MKQLDYITSMKFTQTIILASASKNRRAVLDSLSLPYKVVESAFDETSVNETDHEKRTLILAEKKAETVAKVEKGIILSADTYTISNDKVFEKPKSIAEAKAALLVLSGQTAVSRTGFCYLNTETKFKFLQSVPTKIKFRTLYENEIEIYLRAYPVTTWAGGYALTDLYLLSLIEYIEGSLTGLTHGLPTELLIPLLIKDGYEVKSKVKSLP